MNCNQLLKMEPGEFYDYYLNHLFEAPDNGRVIVSELKKYARYEEDFAFRATVDLVFLLASTTSFSVDKVVSEALDLLDRTNALELWQLVAHCWNILGTTYSRYKMDERAVECFIRAILVESKYGLSAITFVAYFNLGVIFYNLEMHERALEYVKKANLALEKQKTSGLRYQNKLFNHYALTLQILTDLNREEEFEELFFKFRAMNTERFTDAQKYIYYFNEVQYMFLLYGKGKCTIEDCRRVLKNSEKYLTNSDVTVKVAHYYNCIVFCLKRHIEHKYYAEEVLRLEQLLPIDSPKVNATAFRRIIDFYNEAGDVEKIKHFKELYLEALSAATDQYKEQQKNSIDLVETLLIDAVSSNEIGNQNQELKVLYKEAMKIKMELQDAYHRIESINKIGRQLTSALSLNEVIGSFHEVLKEHLRIDTFILFVADEEMKKLRSSIFYYNGVLQPEMAIDFNHPDSLSAKCYRTNQLIHLEPEQQNKAKRMEMNDNIIMRSAAYLPLSVGDKVIGVYTIQHRDYNIYEDELEFLSALAPFVAIALNNTIRSLSLEKEIFSHIMTQNKLKAANETLEKISTLDGLTHVGTRRNFEKKVVELIHDAGFSGDSVSLIMIDVDYFKLYNDTYGHLDGDEVLKKVAYAFKEHMDSVGGISARFGGEEFVGACRGLTYQESWDLAEALRLAIYNLNIEHQCIPLQRITVSIGVSYADADETTTRMDLMRLADFLLYDAKNGGRNRTAIGRLE